MQRAALSQACRGRTCSILCILCSSPILSHIAPDWRDAMLTWVKRLMKRRCGQNSRRSEMRFRPAIEQLENRMLPATSFGFAVSATDQQVYVHQLTLGQTPTGSWTLTAPGRFLNVVGATAGPNGAPLAFAIGVDHQVYRTRFDATAQIASPWDLVAPGQFESIVVDNYGSNNAPILFGISTQSTTARRVFVATFDANVNIVSGWTIFAPGPFDTLVTGHFGTAGGVALFGVN